jgi:hypothetical protein
LNTEEILEFIPLSVWGISCVSIEVVIEICSSNGFRFSSLIYFRIQVLVKNSFTMSMFRVRMKKVTAPSEVVPRKIAYAASTESVFKIGPQVSLDIDDPGNVPFRVVNRYMSNGGFQKGAVKIRLRSTAGHPLPQPFEEFSRGDWCTPFGEAADNVELLQKYDEVSIGRLPEEYAYYRSRRVIKATEKGMSLRSVISDWETRGLMKWDDLTPPDRAFTNALRRFRSLHSENESPAAPYIMDWRCSLFQIHHVDPDAPRSWQHDHHFGVRHSLVLSQVVFKFSLVFVFRIKVFVYLSEN